MTFTFETHKTQVKITNTTNEGSNQNAQNLPENTVRHPLTNQEQNFQIFDFCDLPMHSCVQIVPGTLLTVDDPRQPAWRCQTGRRCTLRYGLHVCIASRELEFVVIWVMFRN